MPDPTQWEILDVDSIKVIPIETGALDLHLACLLQEHGDDPESLVRTDEPLPVLRTVRLHPALVQELAQALNLVFDRQSRPPAES